MKARIGIISYLPEDSKTHKVRAERVKRLISDCHRLLPFPITIIAQNWNNEDIDVSRCDVFYYDKLGITGARKKLREKLLASSADYFILMDDDMVLCNSPYNFNRYLDVLYKQSGFIVEYENFLVNLLGIPRLIFDSVEYDDIDAEKGEGFEDWIYLEKIKAKYPGSYKSITNLKLLEYQRSEMVNDPYSTWITKDVNKEDLSTKSRKIIDENKKLVKNNGK